MIHVDGERLRSDFDALASIGRTPAGGIDRRTFNEAHHAARAWFLERAQGAGLETHVDAAGNHSAVLRAASPGARTILLGSHLDSVPNGGAYDGALGVLAALEALRSVKSAGLELPVTLEAIDFTDEEGTLVGLFGSRALAGSLTPGMLEAPRGGRDALLAGLSDAGLAEKTIAGARRDPESISAYLELHIEQGPVLEQCGAQVGVVTAISGSRSFRLTFEGASRHAGTKPMDARQDAGLGAARFLVRVRETVVDDFPDCVATVGALEFEPGAFNVVPGRAWLALEFRAADSRRLDELESALLRGARDEAETAGLELEVEPVGRWNLVELDGTVRSAITDAASELGLSTRELPSGAGHDAQELAGITRSGMIFVPSANGISHDPGEYTAWEDCINGANVLLQTALRLAEPG